MDLKVLLLATFSHLAVSKAVNITCDPSSDKFGTKTSVICEVTHSLTITSEIEELEIISADNKTLYGFKADGKTIFYLPKGIERCCNVTEVLIIKASKLKDITSDNLKNFPELVHLDLSYNEIRILEKDLFKNNVNLTNIHLNDNQIFAIFPTVFNNLNKIKNLYLGNNSCNPVKENIKEFVKQFSKTELCYKGINQEELRTTRNLIKTERIAANALYYYNNPNDMNNKFVNLSKDMENAKDKIDNFTFILLTEVYGLREEITTIKQKIDLINITVANKIDQLNLLIVENRANAAQDQNQLSSQFESLSSNIHEMDKRIETLSQKSTDFYKYLDNKTENQHNEVISALNAQKIQIANISTATATADDLNNKINDISTATSNIYSKTEALEALITKTTSNITKVTLKSDETHTKIEQINNNMKNISDQIDQLKESSNNRQESPNINIIGCINTFLLIIIVAALMFIVFHVNFPIKPTPMSLPLNSVDNTAVTQLDDDYSPVETRNRNYEPLELNDTYESVPNKETQKNAKRSTNFIPEYECHGFNNEIYGTSNNEDLYSEIISPRRGKSKENDDNDAEIYAVVYKPQREN